MTDQTQQGPKKTETPKDRFEAEFEALPLDQKFARLFKMEAATISEAFDYAVNQPMKVVEKVGDVISEFGAKFETEIKKAARSCEPDPPGPVKEPAAKPKGRGTGKGPRPGAAK